MKITTENEISNSFTSSSCTIFKTKSTIQRDHLNGNTSASEPVVQNYTVYNNNVGNTTVNNDGDSVTVIKTGRNEDDNIDDLEVENKNKRSLRYLRKEQEKQPYCSKLLIFLIVSILLMGTFIAVAFLWKPEAFFSPSTMAMENESTSYSTLTTIVESTTKTSDIQTTRTTSTSPSSFLTPQALHVDINYLADLVLVSNKTRELVIKSTNTTGADTDTLNNLPKPQGTLTVTVVHTMNNNNTDLTHLADVLTWVSNATVRLVLDGNISFSSCPCKNKESLPLEPSFLQQDIFIFPKLVSLEIYHLNLCFISKWVRHFHTPVIKNIKAYSADNGTTNFHRILVKIFNKSTINYQIEII